MTAFGNGSMRLATPVVVGAPQPPPPPAAAAGAGAAEADLATSAAEAAVVDTGAAPAPATLQVVEFNRDSHSGLPKGTILGVLES